MRRRGFSLIEVLVSMLLFSCVFFTLLNLFPAGVAGMRKGRDLVNATHIAQQLVEDVRLVRFEALDEGTTSSTHTVDGVEYRARTTISSRGPRLMDVAVAVTWDVAHKTDSVSCLTSVYHFPNP